MSPCESQELKNAIHMQLDKSATLCSNPGAVLVTGMIGGEEDALGLVGFLLVVLVVPSPARGPAGAAGRPGEAARPACRAGAARRHAERAAHDDDV